ncbi:MAG: hypothetical protein LBG82_00725 [Clostridiales Family XIII bacterium]|jgi:hypothetical protein|nr:hypothetical protein [Clostridiales Family XIII bacterium]
MELPMRNMKTDGAFADTDGGTDDAALKALHKIVDERYQSSFDRSRLTSASDLHKEAKRLLGVEVDYA